MTPKATLIGVPREVRDHILSFVLAPDAPPTVDELVRQQLNNERCEVPSKATGAWEESRSVRFPVGSPAIKRLPLLLVNRQLNAETEALTKRCGQPPFSLDIVFLNDMTLWPTWTNIPKGLGPDEVMDELHVQWRMFKAPDEIKMDMRRSRGMFMPGNGAPEASIWVPYHLLIGVLRYGPGGYREGLSSPRGGCPVRRIIMHFNPPEEEDFELPRRFRIPYRHDHTQGHAENGPEAYGHADRPRHERLALHLAHQLRWLIAIDYHDMIEYGKCLHQQVGSIEIHTGSETISLDLQDQLVRKTPAGPEWGSMQNDREKRWRAFVKWRDRVVERRRRLGLPVGDV